MILDGGGCEFKRRMKEILFVIEATRSSDSTAYHETTKQILELHNHGLYLLTMDCVNVSQDGNEIQVIWDADKHLSEDHVRECADSLCCVVSGLRYV